MRRAPIRMIKRVQHTRHTKITCYQIVWNTTDKGTPDTRVYERLNGGYGVVCYCPAHQYNKTCYHIQLARTFVKDALATPDTPDTPDKRKQ